MLSTVLIVGFIGVSFVSALTLFAACVTVGRVEKTYDNAAGRKQPAAVIDIEWRRLDEQPVTS
ncbi:MAG: hypothetical protein U0175_32510 [Caldilineaceae bacterium]